MSCKTAAEFWVQIHLRPFAVRLLILSLFLSFPGNSELSCYNQRNKKCPKIYIKKKNNNSNNDYFISTVLLSSSYWYSTLAGILAG